MKNQYFGDVGDYGKYGLLKFLTEHDVKIAINWYLTDNDKRPVDGKFTGYLKKEKEWKYSKYDPELYYILQDMLFPEPGVRDVEQFELKNAIPDAIYYHEKLRMCHYSTREERKPHRDEWHKKALDVCNGAELVFLDPDNGLMQEPEALCGRHCW